MNRNEYAEIRRRFNPDKNNITCVRGCYVDTKGEIISTFNRPLLTMPQEEAEKYLALFRKTLSGTPGKNLVEIQFDPFEAQKSENHQALMALRETCLKQDDLAEDFFTRVISSLKLDDNYLILMMHDAYDVPFKARDDVKVDDASEEMYHYILCAICPVKLSKPALSYYAAENEFHPREQDWVVGAPDLGFLFPSFDDRTSNIYKVVYYNRDINEPHEELTDGIFGTQLPMLAVEQMANFQSVLEEALDEDLSFDVVQTVHEQLRDIVDKQKTDKEAEAPVISKREVRALLESCGVPDRRIEDFETIYDEQIGAATDMNVESIVNTRQFQVRTPDVTIRVAPERSDLIETRVIEGTKYILIRADDGVEVNGVNININ